MKITIVTTCHNRADTIADALRSVQSQDFPEVEHIIIDGASTDGTQEVVRQHGAGVARFVSEPDGGMYEAINKGIMLSTGDVVGLLHSDDLFYATDTLSRMAHEMQRTDTELVYGNGVYVKSNDINHVVRDWVSGTYMPDRIRRGWLPLHTTVFIRREALRRVGLYDERYKIASDTDWLIRCLYENELRVSYLNDYVVRMRMGGASTNFHLTQLKWREDMAIYKAHHLGRIIPLTLKVASKMPQFAKAWVKRKVNHYKDAIQGEKATGGRKASADGDVALQGEGERPQSKAI